MLAEDPEKQWRYAEDLAVGDTVFWGLEMQLGRIVALERQETVEEVYDLEVKESRSFLTETCAVHNCGFSVCKDPRRLREILTIAADH